MIILVYGEDTFRVHEKRRVLQRAFGEKHDPHGTNSIEFRFDEKKIPVADVLQSMCTLPFFGRMRMVVVHGLIASVAASEKAVWVDGLRRIPDSTIVLLCEEECVEIIEKKPLFVSIKTMENVHMYPFSFLTGLDLEKWVNNRIHLRGGQIDTKATQILVEYLGSDLWRIDNEIQKLVAYVNGGLITSECIENLIVTSNEDRIFPFLDAVSQKQPQQALSLLHKQRLFGSDEMYLLSMLNRQVRLLIGARSFLDEKLRVDTSTVAKILGVPPFVASRLLSSAQKFTPSHLKETHTFLFEYDNAIKNGHLSIDVAVDLITSRFLLES